MKLLFRLVFILIFFLNLSVSFSQTKEDKLRKQIEIVKDTSLINAYLDLAKYYYQTTGKGDSLILFSNKALELSKKLKDSQKELEAYKYAGVGYLINKNFDKSEDYFKKSLGVAIERKDIKNQANLHNKLGVLYENKDNIVLAIEHLIEAAKYSKEITDYRNEAQAYYGISAIYAQKEQFDKQLSYIEKAIKITKENDINDSYLESIIYTDASQTYLELFVENSDLEYEKQLLNYSEKALKIASENNFEPRKVVVYSILGKYHNLKKNYTKAEFFAKQVINSESEITNASLINAYTLLVEVYTVQDKKWLAFRYVDSLNSSNLKSKSSFGEAISNSSYLAYKHFKENESALKSLEEKVEFSKEFNNVSKTKALNELEVKYQSKLKDAEIKNLNQNQQITDLEITNKKAKIKQLTFWLVSVGLLMVLLLFVIKMIQLKKMRQKNSELKVAFDKQIQLEKELTDVRDEIAQDFHDDLGNKLARISLLSNLVSGEISINDPKVKSKIVQITEDANGLYKGTRDFVFSLKSNSDYIEEIATYLSDFGEDFFSKTKIKFIVKKNISSNDKLPHYWNKQLVFLFKEAMTNTLKHSKCDTVNLAFVYNNKELTITCSDNGIGISENDMVSSNGLKNMKERAQKINGLLTISSNREKGTMITFSGKVNK